MGKKPKNATGKSDGGEFLRCQNEVEKHVFRCCCKEEE